MRPRPPLHYWRDGLFMSLAVGVIGMTFGVFADSVGLGLAQIVVMSAVVCAGAAQFVAVGVVASGGTEAAAVGSALLLAARYALYGPVLRRFLPPSLPGRLGAAHLVIDQSTAMAVAQTNRRDGSGAFWLTGITLWLCWLAGSVAGTALGGVMGDAEKWGLDAALPAIFVALVAPHLRSAPGRVAAVVAAVVVVVAVPFTAAGVPILLSVVALVPAALVQARRRQHPHDGPAPGVGSGPAP